MTLEEAISRYQRALKARGLSLESQKNYAGTIAWLHKQTGDAWPTYPVLVDWLSGMEVAKTTMHHRTANVKRFFAWCVDMEYIEKDPAAKLIVPKRGKNNPATLSPSQVEFCSMSGRLSTRSVTPSWPTAIRPSCASSSCPGSVEPSSPR